jgi:hypothetical protein
VQALHVYQTRSVRLPSLLILVSALLASAHAQSNGLDAKVIAKAAGTEATAEEDGVVRIGWSREDVPSPLMARPYHHRRAWEAGRHSRP